MPKRKKNLYVHVVCKDCGFVVIGAKVVYFAIPSNWTCPKCNPSRHYEVGTMVKKGMLIAQVVEE